MKTQTDRKLSAVARPPAPPPIIRVVSTLPTFFVFLQIGARFPAFKACSVAERKTFPARTETSNDSNESREGASSISPVCTRKHAPCYTDELAKKSLPKDT